MKKLNLFSNLWSSLVGSRKDESRTRLRVVFDSFTCRLRVCPLKLVSVLAILLTLGVGNVLGASPYTFNSSIPTTGWSTSGGSQTINSVSWTYSSCTYIGANGTRIQIGSANNPQASNWTIQTAISNFGSGIKVTAVAITGYATQNASYSSYDISVGGNSVKSGSFSTSSNTYTASSLNVTSGSIVITLKGSSGTNNTKALYLSNISVTYEANTPAYTITATSNNDSYGTVSLSGTTITATPAAGYRVMSGTDGYTVTSGSATVVNNGDNTFTVTPSSNCTVRINFESKGCTDHGASSITSGASSGDDYGPIHAYYKYSTSQILYTKSDLDLAAGKKGTIKSIYFEYSGAAAMAARTIKIYMANTDLSSLTTSNYVPYASFTQVYSGTFSCGSAGWYEITLDTPFDYNGAGQLAVMIDDNTNSYQDDKNFKYHSATGKQIYKRQDSGDIDPASWTPASAIDYRPNTKFCIQEADMVAATVTLMDNSATLTEESAGSGVTLPARTGCTGYTFAGWTKSWVAEQDEWTTTAPTIISAGSYYPLSDENLYPVYTKSEGEYVSVTGGDMSSGLTTGWYTTTAGTYSGSNGVKFDDEGDWILSDDFSSENLTKVTVKFKAGNNGAAGSVLRFEAIDEEGYEITGVDFSPTEAYNSQSTVNTVVIDAGEKIYTVAVELKSKTNNVGMKYCEVFKGGPITSYISVPNCCDKNITIGTPSITGSGDVTFTFGGDAISAGDVVETCSKAQDVVATVTPETGYECTALTFSGGSVSVDPTPGASNYPAYSSTQDYTLSFGQNTTSATLTTSATFTAKSVTGWTWKQELADASEITIPTTVELYVGQQARFNLKSYAPEDVINDNKGYSASYTSADLAQDSKAGAYYVTRAKVAKESTTLTLTSTNNALVQQVITIRIKALPLVHFVDKIHGESFDDVVANVDATEKRTVYTTKPTPTHDDISDPGSSYNTCERQHLHLVGWILSTWADANPGATHSQILGAGSGKYYAAGASINVETHDGDTFYAVWSKIE